MRYSTPNFPCLRQQRDMTQEQLAFDAEIDLTYLGGIRGARGTQACL